jgi:hypothetical protein
MLLVLSSGGEVLSRSDRPARWADHLDGPPGKSCCVCYHGICLDRCLCVLGEYGCRPIFLAGHTHVWGTNAIHVPCARALDWGQWKAVIPFRFHVSLLGLFA